MQHGYFPLRNAVRSAPLRLKRLNLSQRRRRAHNPKKVFI